MAHHSIALRRRWLVHVSFAIGLALLVAGCASSSPAASGADERARAPRGIVPGTAMNDEANTVRPEVDLPPVRYVEELLVGRVAGVQVQYTPTGGIRVLIRGQTHLSGSNEPIYVVDGMIVISTPGAGLTGLSPYDIAKIEVLKSGAATSIYGMQGSNGAVLVTTKLSDDD